MYTDMSNITDKYSQALTRQREVKGQGLAVLKQLLFLFCKLSDNIVPGKCLCHAPQLVWG